MLFVLVSLVPVAVVSGAVADSLLSALGGELTSGDEVSQPSSSREDKVSSRVSSSLDSNT